MLGHGHKQWSWPPTKLHHHRLRNEDPKLPHLLSQKVPIQDQQTKALPGNQQPPAPFVHIAASILALLVASPLLALCDSTALGANLHPGCLGPKLKHQISLRVTTWCHSCTAVTHFKQKFREHSNFHRNCPWAFLFSSSSVLQNDLLQGSWKASTIGSP